MECNNCRKIIQRRNYNENRNKHNFCNRLCYEKWWKKNISTRFIGEGNNNWDKNKVFKKCFICSKEFRVTGSRKIWGKFCSQSCKGKWQFSGSRNPLWKGGIPREKRTELPEYEYWRKEVYKRDWYRCKICGYKGKLLVAHHIKTWKNFPKLKFEVNNGITLCRSCHCKLHTIHKNIIDFKEILRDFMSETQYNALR